MSDAENATAAAAESDTPAAPPVELALSDAELRALCKDQVCAACPEKAEFDDGRLRLLAEVDNTRKRMQREMEEFRKYAADNVLADLVPVLDNLELALAHGRGAEACKDLVLGVDMTVKIFLDILSRHGLTAVGAVGEAFTPELHEAVGQEERADLPEGQVSQLLQKGYKLKDRLLRPAKVVVSKAPAQ